MTALWALSDLHIGHAKNREALATCPERPDDWLILGGDLGETAVHVAWVFAALSDKFARLVWVPGNHELWTHPRDPDPVRGVARYERLVEIARKFGVLTPEDPYETVPGTDLALCPLFVGFDYSFAPGGPDRAAAVAWASELRQVSADESYLHADPFPDAAAWCADRLRYTAARLDALGGQRTLLVNHWPLRKDLVRIPAVPRFLPWCGTTATADWHLRYRAAAVVHGHLHVPATDWRDGVRFEEVSLGYPPQWNVDGGLGPRVRQVWPGDGRQGPETVWRW